MGKLLSLLKKYFEETHDQLDKDWEELKYLNYFGPDVFEYYNKIKSNK